VEEEVKTTETKIQVKIIEPKVGIEPLVVVHVEITKTIVEEHMFRRIRNTLISFFVILQGFRGWNPKCRRGNVKGVG